MDDLGAKLGELLNHPEALERVKKMAEELFSGEESEDPPQEESAPDIAGMMKLVSRCQSMGDNDRTRFLQSLKPFLSENRQKKTDTAIRLLKVVELYPLIRESGIL